MMKPKKAKTAKIEAWTAGGDANNADRITPKNPRFSNLQGAQKMKLEKGNLIQRYHFSPYNITNF